MTKSNSITEIAKALIIFHSKVDNIKKDAINPFFKSSYCTLDNILNTIEAPLNAAGLTFVQFPSGDHGLTTLLMHESGEWLECEYFMKPSKDDPQGNGSAITYQRRYAISAMLGLATDTDDDGNEATTPKREVKPEVKIDDELPWLNENSKEFSGAVEKMRAGKSTVAALRKFFKISKATETKLIEQSQLSLQN